MKTREEIQFRITKLQYENEGLEDLILKIEEPSLHVQLLDKIREYKTIIEALQWTLKDELCNTK